MEQKRYGQLERSYAWSCECASCDTTIAATDVDYTLEFVASFAAAAKMMRGDGWRLRDGAWYCPECVENKAWREAS